MASLQELLAQNAELEAKIAEVQTGVRAEAIAKIRATMADRDFCRVEAGPWSSMDLAWLASVNDLGRGDTRKSLVVRILQDQLS